MAFVVKHERVLNDVVYAKPGDKVYPAAGYDYGLASDDTWFTGVKHVSVTADPAGGIPYFTIPKDHLELVE